MNIEDATKDLAKLQKTYEKQKKELEAQKPTPRTVAERFIEEQGEEPTLYYSERRWLMFKGKKYEQIEDEVFTLQLLNHFNLMEENDKRVTTHVNKEIVAQIKSITPLPDDTHAPCFIKGKQREVIPLNNGLLDIKKLIVGKEPPLLPHTPDYLCYNVLEYNYDPEALCPKWDEFLLKVLPDEDQRELLREWIGYNLISATNLEAFMIFYGQGANGKSVVCQVLTQLLGIENISALGLEHINPDKFMFGMIVDKMANICDDLNEVSKNNEGHLRNFVGGLTHDLQR